MRSLPLLLLAGCEASLTCGSGTTEEDGVCVADEVDDDTDVTDTGTDGSTNEGCVLQLLPEDSDAPQGPVVQSTCPRNGAVGVDPGLDRIEVAFSRPMADGYWSWVQVDDDFPEVSDVYYESDRVHVGLVDLEPNSTYAIWFNHAPDFLSFVDTGGQPAVPYFLVFETGSAR